MQRLGRRAPALAALVGLWAGPGAAATLDPPQQYLVRGAGFMTVAGTRCCGGARFTGRFEAAYQVEADGSAVLNRLRVELDDTLAFYDGPLFADGRVPVRCGTVDLVEPAAGYDDGTGFLAFAPSAVSLSGLSFEEREADGSCSRPNLTFFAANDRPLRLEHAPASNRVALDATLRTEIAGENHDVHLVLTGRFANRPPVAVLGLTAPQYPQAWCPATWRWISQTWEQVAEANAPEGLKAGLLSLSYDPDGAWAAADLLGARFFHSRDGGPRAVVAEGPQAEPMTFEWGPRHTLELLVSDTLGASAADVCRFRVIDTTPPLVTPPAATVECSQPGGASPATQPALRAFLAGATAVDLGDAAPLQLAPQVAGSDVGDATLFAADGWPHAVSFRFRDRFDNLGSAEGQVSVVDTKPPSLALGASPPVLPADYKFWVVAVSASLYDACGGPLLLTLVSIKSNAPAYDAGDILDAAYGSDDRSFVLRARPAGATPRVYTALYRAVDAAGNVTHATVAVRVGE